MQPSRFRKEERQFFDVHASRKTHRLARFFGWFPRVFARGNVVNLRPHFAKRHRAIVAIVTAVFVLGIWVGNRLLTRAGVADFYPSTCLGNWQSVHLASGQPENFNSASALSGINENNAAVYYGPNGQIYCGGFLSPEAETKGDLTSVALTLVWRIDRGEALLNESSTSPHGASVPATPSGDSGGAPPSESGMDESPQSEEQSPQSDVMGGRSFFSFMFGSVHAQETDVLSVSDEQNIPETGTDESSGMLPEEPQTFILPPLQAEFDAVSTTTLPLPPDATSTLPTSTAALPAPPPVLDENFLRVTYSLNGRDWNEIGRVSEKNWENFTVPIPVVTWEELKQIQISIEGIPTTLNQIPRVYLAGMFVEAKYDIPPLFGGEEEHAAPPTEGIAVVPLSSERGLIPAGDGGAEWTATEHPEFDLDLGAIDGVTPSSSSPSEFELTPTSTTGEVPEPADSGAQEPEPSGGSALTSTMPEPVFPVLPPLEQGTSSNDVTSFLNRLLYLAPRTYAQEGGGDQTETEHVPPELPTTMRPVVARVYDPNGAETGIAPTFLTVHNKLRVSVPEPKSELRPGRYQLKVWVLRGGTVYYTQSDFIWGVLALNFNKSIYTAGDTAYVQFGVLTDDGSTVCDAEIEIAITAPSGDLIERSTANGSISQSTSCGPNSVTSEPDYSTQLTVQEAGTYNVRTRVDNGNGTREFLDTFAAQERPLFDVERIGPTRIYPLAEYEMQIRVTANEDMQGEIVESVPQGFRLFPNPVAEIKAEGGRETLRWPVDLKAGDTATLSYRFDAPDMSPYLYKLGPLTISDWQEVRQWQIASDSVDNSGSVIVYGSAAQDDNLQYRTLIATSTWSGAGATVDVTSETFDIKHVVIKAAPTRNEFIAGHLKAGGRLDFIRASGTNAWAHLFTVPTSSPVQACDATLNICTQTFDIAYEQLSGDALMVYGLNGTSGIVYYRTWDGNATSSESSFSVGAGGAESPRWFQLVPKGERLTDNRSDEMILVMIDQNADVFAAIWDGTSFGNTTTLTVNGQRNSKSFAAAWETRSGAAVVIYASSSVATTDPMFYREFRNGAWSVNATSAITFSSQLGASQVPWIDMAADPTSDRLAVGFSTEANDGKGLIWKLDGTTPGFTSSGAAFDTTLEVTTARGMAVAWERYNNGDGFALFTLNDDQTADSLDYFTWTSSTQAFSSVLDVASGWTDDGNTRKMKGHPNSDETMLFGVDSDNDLRTQFWNGGLWTTSSLSVELATDVGTSTDGNATIHENNAFDAAYKPYSPWTRNWRWYSGTSTLDTPLSGDALAAENTSSTGVDASSGQVRLRFNMIELGGNKQVDNRKVLQYTTGTDPNASSTPWTDVANIGSSTAVWRYFDVSSTSAVGDDGQTLGGTVLTSSTVAGWWNTSRSSTSTASMDHSSSTVVELEFAIEAASATANTLYYFRMYDIFPTSTLDRILGTPVYRQQTSFPATPCNGIACTYPHLRTAGVNAVPEVSAVTVNNGSAITLTVNATTSILVNFTVTDTDGCSDVFTSGNVTTTLYRSGVSTTCGVISGPTTDNQNCYLPVSTTNNCSAGNSANATATFDVWHFAQPTTASSTYPSENWQAFVVARDAANATGSSSTASGVELNILLGFEVTSSTNYGTVAPNTNTGATNRTTTVKNAGNFSSTLNIAGVALTLGAASISTSSQHYATSSFTYGGAEQALQAAATAVSGFFLLAPTSTTAVSSTVFWGLAVPGGSVTGTYTGTNTFTAVWSP